MFGAHHEGRIKGLIRKAGSHSSRVNWWLLSKTADLDELRKFSVLLSLMLKNRDLFIYLLRQSLAM